MAYILTELPTCRASLLAPKAPLNPGASIDSTNTQFDFLGYTFRPKLVKNGKRNSMFVSFTPAVSKAAVKAMRETTRKLNYRNRTELSLADISRLHNPILRGWLAYYGRFCRSAMYPVLRHFNKTFV